MNTKHSSKWLLMAVLAGIVMISQRTAFADDWFQSLFGSPSQTNNNVPDQKQIQADQATAARLQQAYQNDRQALAQAYSSGNRQNIQSLQSAVNTDIQHMQSNAQDLSKGGVAYPYTIPYNAYNQGYPTRPDRQWENRGTTPGYNPPTQWENRGSRPSGWSHGKKIGWDGRDVPPDSGYDRSNRQWDNRVRDNH